MDTACVMKPQEMGNTAGNVSTYECVLHTVVSREDRSKGSGFQKACYELSRLKYILPRAFFPPGQNIEKSECGCLEIRLLSSPLMSSR